MIPFSYYGGSSVGTHVARSRCTLNHMITFNHSILEAALAGLETQKRRIDAQIAEVRAMLFSHPGQSATTPEAAPRQRRKFSAATRRRMKEAQRRRWPRSGAKPSSHAESTETQTAALRGRKKGHRSGCEEAVGFEARRSRTEEDRSQEGRCREGSAGKTVKKSAPVEKPVVKTAKKTALPGRGAPAG